MLKLVVFDCDGVMFNSREANRAYYNHMLAAFSCPPMDETEVDFVHVHSVIDSVARIFRRHRHIELDAVNAFRQQLDYAPFLKYMLMEPDLLDFLRTIKPLYHTAISTNRMTTMEMILDIFQLRPWFDKVVTAADTPRPKPAPDGMLMLLEHFRLRPEEVIYIGDSIVDQDLCATVGVDLIAFRNPQLAARYHVDSFTGINQLPPFLSSGRS